MHAASSLPSERPFRTNRADAIARFINEDLRYWLKQRDKKPIIRELRELIDLWGRYRFFPYQYLKHDLFIRAVGESYREYIPSLLADRFVYVVNPKHCIDWLEDKLQFDARMAATGLAYIPTLAVLTPNADGLTIVDSDGAPISLDALWSRARAQSPRGVFVKPRLGLGGQGAFRLDVGASGFERNGAALSQADLAARLRASGFDDFLLQPYFEQHPELARINPSSVNTLRILTLRTGDHVEIIASYLRVGGGHSETDNGSYGGFAAHADLVTGQVGAIGKVHLTFAPTRGAERHPVTGVAFGDIAIPHAAAIAEFVARGARAFAPLRIIGWDIAIGPDGPCAVEANSIPGFRPVQDVCGGLRFTPYGAEMAAHYGWR